MPSWHQARKRPIVNSSFNAGTRIVTSGSATSFAGTSRRSAVRSSGKDNACAFQIEAEVDLPELVQRRANRGLGRGRTVQDEKAAAPGPGELAAQGAGGQGRLIESIDPRCRDLVAERAFQQPALEIGRAHV